MSNWNRSLTSKFCLLILSICATSALGQTLPQGKWHPNRERGYDIRHYSADLELDFADQSLTGTVTIELAALRRIEDVALDAKLLEIAGVKVDGTPAEFVADGQRLRISLVRPADAGQSIAVEVRYSAHPRAGLYFQRDPGNDGQFFVMTYGEGGLHANWLPIYNDVNDRFTSEMRVTVPPPYTVVSNGSLLSSAKQPDGRTTWHWKQEKPHPNYLISIYAGEFERGDLPPAFGSIPLAYWVPRGRLAEGAFGFRNTTRMVEFYSERFGVRYPWVKYDQIAIPDYPIGAMEHTGVTGHDAGVLRPDAASAPDDFGPPTLDAYDTDWTAEATISHELAHHWFGDMVTCRSLSQIWLNESFASYLMMLWSEELYGDDELLFDVDLARRHYLAYVEKEHKIRPLEYAYYDAPDDMYNTEHTYLKGGAVLHMLRGILGDEPFFRALRYYLEKHAFSNVESRDLKIAIEESTGENLDWFFADWVAGGGHPVFEVDYRWLEDTKQVDLRIKQVQSIVDGQDTFRLPVTIGIATEDSSWETTVQVAAAEERFLLPCATKPLWVSVDPRGSLVADIHFDKKRDELVRQANGDALIGRLRALRQLAARYPTGDATLAAFGRIVGDDATFWGLRAEAAQLLGTLRTPGAEQLAGQALLSADYRVRKAAVLGLPGFGTPAASDRLRAVIRDDKHTDVVAAAILALAKADPDTDTAIFTEQLGRDAWYDEIRMAVMKAFEELGRPELLATVRPYADERYNMAVRQAALEAWAEIAPTDRKLHGALRAAAASPPYPLQKFAIERLGLLHVKDAVPFLEDLVKADPDPNLTKRASEALVEIRRIP